MRQDGGETATLTILPEGRERVNGLKLRIGRVDRRILHALAHRRHRWVTLALAHRRHRWVTLALRTVSHLGDPPVIACVAGLLLLGAVPGTGALGRHVAFALIVSHLLSQLLKRVVSRPRPTLPIGLGSVIDPPDRFSFPSGHASATLSVALPLFLMLPPAAGAPFLLLALVVGISRCYLGVHYPGDVVVGWALGALAVVLTGLLLA